MITLEQLLHSCEHESNIIKHIATRLPADCLEYRPTEKQRTMLELMQYVTRASAAPMCYAVDNTWDRGMVMHEGTSAVTAENFADEMDAQMTMLRDEAGKLADKPLDGPCMMPWREECTLGEFLVNAVLKALTAYRMQFFLYAKAAGAEELSTADCWIGKAATPQA